MKTSHSPHIVLAVSDTDFLLGDDEIIRMCEAGTLIILDFGIVVDFGDEDRMNEYEANLFVVMETRTSWNRETIIQTPLSTNEIIAAFPSLTGKSIIRRILEFCDIVKL